MGPPPVCKPKCGKAEKCVSGTCKLKATLWGRVMWVRGKLIGINRGKVHVLPPGSRGTVYGPNKKTWKFVVTKVFGAQSQAVVSGSTAGIPGGAKVKIRRKGAR